VRPEGAKKMIPYKPNLDQYNLRANLAIWGRGSADIRPIYRPSLCVSAITLGAPYETNYRVACAWNKYCGAGMVAKSIAANTML
jgi:hypothetical protein